jgi:hypothetical protein
MSTKPNPHRARQACIAVKRQREASGMIRLQMRRDRRRDARHQRLAVARYSSCCMSRLFCPFHRRQPEVCAPGRAASRLVSRPVPVVQSVRVSVHLAGEVLGRRRWLDTLIRPSECLGATDYLELVLAALKLGSQRTGRSSGVPVPVEPRAAAGHTAHHGTHHVATSIGYK